MRKFLITTDVLMILICTYSVVEYLNKQTVPTYILFPCFILALKLGALLGSKFYEDYKQ